MPIFFFTGPVKNEQKKEEKHLDQFGLDRELNRRVSEFAKKYGVDSVSVFDSENWDDMQVNQSIFGGGLFYQKTLTVLKGLPLSADRKSGFSADMVSEFTENIKNKIDKIPSENLLIFVNGNPDKRSKLFKILGEHAKINEFIQPNESELKNFVKNSFGNIQIEESVVKYFLEKVGNDMYRIYFEIDKLKEYCQCHAISLIDQKLVDEVVFGMPDVNTFLFLDEMFHDKNRALHMLQDMQRDGINWNEIGGALYRGLKLYIILEQYIKKGETNPRQISKESGLSYRGVSNALKYKDKLLKNGTLIKNMYKDLIEADFDIKSGKVSEDFFWLNIKKNVLKFN